MRSTTDAAKHAATLVLRGKPDLDNLLEWSGIAPTPGHSSPTPQGHTREYITSFIVGKHSKASQTGQPLGIWRIQTSESSRLRWLLVKLPEQDGMS